MTDVVLGRGSQTYSYTRTGSGSDVTILDFKSIYYFAFLNGAEAGTSATETAEIEFALNFKRDRLTFLTEGNGLDFGGQTGSTLDDVTGFHIQQGAPGQSGNIVFGIINPSSDLNGDLVVNAGAETVFSAWDSNEGANGATLLTQRTNLDAGLLYADIHLNGSASSSIRGQILKQDAGDDLIDVSSLNIGDYATLLALFLNFPGATLSSEGVLQTFLDGDSYKLTLAGSLISGLHPNNFVFNTSNAADTFNGGANRDDFFGGGGNDTLNGGGDVDRLFGEAGNDVLNGGTGSDIMYGGTGNDTFYVDTISETIKVAEGIDKVFSSINWTLAAAFENLTLTGADNLNGTGNASNNVILGNTGTNLLRGLAGNDALSGGSGADTLIGDDGNDILQGGTGVDQMTGGTGNDTYYFDTIGDTATEAAGAGIDLVFTVMSISSLGANIEQVRMLGSGNLQVKGNDLANGIVGNAGNNSIVGFGGNDILIGGGGRDTMAGGTGADDFHFDALSELGNTAATRDIITDFAVGIDDLDFNTMDANSVLAGNQNFAFRATGAFTAAGQLRFVLIDAAGTANDMTVVQGNLDGNLSTVEFEVELRGLHNLTAGDFVL